MSLPILKDYDFRQVMVLVGGQQITGYGDGGGIAIAPNDDRYELAVGDDGHKTRVRKTDDSLEVTLTLQQSAQSNATLFALYQSEATFAFACEDFSGTTIVGSADAFISRLPDMDFSEELSDREWTIVLPFPRGLAIGGNRAASSVL